MERHQVAESIRRAWGFLESSGLAETFASADPLPVDEDFRELILSPETGHEELYTFCLRGSYFNFLLFDHSFFQFSWFASNDVRYAFYPNPHVSKPEALHKFRKYREMVKDEVISEGEYSQLVQAMRFDGGIPIFRYENSPAQYVRFSHPCSHLHIGVHGDNRWAVSRLLTPLVFSMLIVKHYFPSEWAEESSRFENDLIKEKNTCQILGEEHFCEEEKRSFHFG